MCGDGRWAGEGGKTTRGGNGDHSGYRGLGSLSSTNPSHYMKDTLARSTATDTHADLKEEGLVGVRCLLKKPHLGCDTGRGRTGRHSCDMQLL